MHVCVSFATRTGEFRPKNAEFLILWMVAGKLASLPCSLGVHLECLSICFKRLGIGGHGLVDPRVIFSVLDHERRREFRDIGCHRCATVIGNSDSARVTHFDRKGVDHSAPEMEPCRAKPAGRKRVGVYEACPIQQIGEKLLLV